jgi:hypothetical protein
LDSAAAAEGVVVVITITITTALHQCIIKYNAMKTYGGVEVLLHEFLTSVLDGGEFQLRALAAFPPGKESPITTG